MSDRQVEPAEHGTEGPVEDVRIAAFWQAARGHVGFGKLDVIVGESPEDVVSPPSWSYGDDAEAAELLARVLDGRKTANGLAVAELEQVGLEVPRVGDLSIVVDGEGTPRALLRTTEVQVVPFDQVPAEHAAAEAEDDGSLETWRARHEESWRRVLGEAFSPSLDVMLERFELVYPTDGPTPAVD
ncbi:ASCH domain-containing protein [uncultured Cellulomonas sp.]|uniref:ASCH domain-containing protein n=1 Tax=uncultured Cellulomonas sp. TaxID=189682 RepID=UPI0028EAF247|nr:ASCH domain-containing protein [uncultured Cellulomonas sp.]